MNTRAGTVMELAVLSVGETLYVKYCTANNIMVAVTTMRKNGLDFRYYNSGSEYSVIRRTA